jgi:heavy metal translocating P-type ATPase
MEKIKARFNFYLSIASLIAVLLSFFFGKDLLILIMVVGGIPLFLQIILKLFKGDFGADLLAALALLVSAYLGEYLAANLIIFMLASGQALEDYAMKKASSVLLLLAKRMPTKAWLKIGDESKEIEVGEIKIGDEIVVRPHEICPVDGVVIEGRGAMDESYLTGEPYKLTKLPGSGVLSGAINGNSLLIIKAEKLAADSSYAKIMKVMELAESNRPNLRRVADQIGAIFTPVSLVFAFATLYFTGDLNRFLAILVVATPCPLLIAIPVTIISAISISAKRGIIIKDPRVLERLPTCVTAIFDKTGTLTCGEPSLTEIVVAPGFEKNDVLQKVASLENYSRHPLAISILDAAKKANLPILNVTNISEKPGQGMRGHVVSDEIFVTSRKALIAENKNFENILPETEAGLECVIMINDKYAAIFRFRDTPRPDGHSFIHHLEPSHAINRIILLSGDRESEVLCRVSPG